jgi:hypothetical protein
MRDSVLNPILPNSKLAPPQSLSTSISPRKLNPKTNVSQVTPYNTPAIGAAPVEISLKMAITKINLHPLTK